MDNTVLFWTVLLCECALSESKTIICDLSGCAFHELGHSENVVCGEEASCRVFPCLEKVPQVCSATCCTRCTAAPITANAFRKVIRVNSLSQPDERGHEYVCVRASVRVRVRK